jgi:hypothetical protein
VVVIRVRFREQINYYSVNIRLCRKPVGDDSYFNRYAYHIQSFLGFVHLACLVFRMHCVLGGSRGEDFSSPI